MTYDVFPMNNKLNKEANISNVVENVAKLSDTQS